MSKIDEARTNAKFSNWLLMSALFFCACQPLTRQDRATVGPEPTPTAFSGQQTQQDSTSQPDDSAAGAFATVGVSSQWESTMNTQCEQGRPAACSSLAYEAARTQRTAAAAELFKRACLMDQSAAQCSSAGSDSRGSARSCLELSSLLQQQGQLEEARRFRACACERSYKPACVVL